MQNNRKEYQPLEDDQKKIKIAMGEALVKLMESHGETKSTLAEKVLDNMSEANIKKYRNGDSAIPYHILFKLCNHYKCDVDYLLGITEEETRQSHDLHEITGLNEKACTALSSILETEEDINIVSWMISNGLLSIGLQIDQMAFSYSSMTYILENMPVKIKSVLSKVINTDKQKNKLSLKSAAKIAKWISTQNTSTVDALNTMFWNLDIDPSSQTQYNYNEALLYKSDYLHTDEPEKNYDARFHAAETAALVEGLAALDESKMSAKQKENYQHIKQKIDSKIKSINDSCSAIDTDAVSRIHQTDKMSHEELYRRCITFINNYFNAEKERQIALFNISANIVEIANKYTNESKDILHAANELAWKDVLTEARTYIEKEDEK